MTLAAQKQLRHVFKVISGATPASGNADYWGGGILWATPEDISSLESYWLRDTRRKITQAGHESCGTTTVPAHSVLLTKRAPIGQVALLAEEACSNQGCFLLIPRAETDTRFYYYWLLAHTAYLQTLGCGSTFMELSTDELKSLAVPDPPLSKQRAIADYLDRETARIDALVAEKERLLDLLAEKRRALITRGVTHSLYSDLASAGNRRKVGAGEGENHVVAEGGDDVGAATLPWPTKRLRFLAKPGGNFSLATAGAHEITFLPMEAIGEQGQLDLSTTRPVDEVQSGYSRFSEGDVVIAKITPCFENGKGALIRGTATGFGFGTTELYTLTPRPELDGRFLYYVTVQPRFRQLGEARMTGAAGQKRVPEDFVWDFQIPVPPLSRQRAIADYLDRETARLDMLSSMTRETIALLKERRAALISAAVTGQIDVKGAA